MNFRRHFGSMSLLARFTTAAAFMVAILCGAHAAEHIAATVGSGGNLSACHDQFYYRVDAKGKEWPVTIQFTARPKNGAATTRSFSIPVSVNGQSKTVRAVKVYYQSRKGFIGQDSFTYRRITADPTDSDSGKEFTVAVTVR